MHGDILFAIAGATVGKVNIVTEDLLPANTNQALAIIRVNDNEDYVFIYQVLKSEKMRSYIKDSIAIGAQPNMNLAQMGNFCFSRPHINEQKKIASFLTTIDKRIQTQNKIINQLKALINSLSLQSFGDETQGHTFLPLKSLCSIKKGEQINGSQLSVSGLYYVMNGGITPSGYHSKFNTTAGTISISEGGNSCGYVQYNETDFWSGGHCYTLLNINSAVEKKYLYYYLKAYESQIMTLRIGSGLPNIQKSSLEKFEVKILQLDKQKKIISLLDNFSKKVSLEIEINEKNHQLKKILLMALLI